MGIDRIWRGAPTPTVTSPRGAYAALSVLLLVQVMNIADRELLFILMTPIKGDLHASDTQMGLLTGLAFSLFYVIAGVPLARAADRRNRRDMLAVCLSVWSAATMMCGAVASYAQLLAARIGVATGEAAAGPTAQSMLADLFPRDKRTRAVGLFFAGASAGHFVGLYVGGLVAEHHGWRAAFVVFGLTGLLLALLIWLFVPEPRRGAMEAVATEEPASLKEVMRALFGMRSFTLLIVAFTLANVTNYARLAWGPTFLLRVHHMSLAEVGFWLGVVSALGSAAGNIVSGILTDRLIRRGNHWFATVPALSLLLATPLSLVFILSDSPMIAIAALAPTAFLMGTAFTPSSALVLALASARIRAMAVAIMMVATTLIGGSLGPFLVGYFNDLLAPNFGQDAVRYSLLILPAVFVIAAMIYLLCARCVETDFSKQAVPDAIDK